MQSRNEINGIVVLVAATIKKRPELRPIIIGRRWIFGRRIVLINLKPTCTVLKPAQLRSQREEPTLQSVELYWLSLHRERLQALY
jgi:hypothetical protein